MNIRKTKIVATLGPASSEEKVLFRMIAAGMDVARLNLSHGELKEHARLIRLIRKIAKKQNRSVAILADLQGPKIRIGSLKEGRPVQLFRNKKVSFTTRRVLGDATLLHCTYPHLVRDVKVGDPILLDDGRLQLEVVSKKNHLVICKVVQGGWLKERKGMNLPGTRLSQPSLTKKDIKDLQFVLGEGVDYLALSFVRSAKDVEQLREILKQKKIPVPIIAKIERAESIQHLDEILAASDGVMVARGDLGVEVSFERVPVLQKQIIDKANTHGVPVITATQMLESMIQNPRPTRAEASDVANAIFDGTDAVMLSGETASGAYPVESIKVMNRIALEAEKNRVRELYSPKLSLLKRGTSYAIVHAACQAAEEVKAKAILAFTLTGYTALLLSKLKPQKPIFAFAESLRVYRRLALFWGVIPLRVSLESNTDALVRVGEKTILKTGHLKQGDCVVIVAGTTHLKGATDMLKVHTFS